MPDLDRPPPPHPPDPLGRLPTLNAPPGGRCAGCRRPAAQWAGSITPMGIVAVGVCADCAAMVSDGRLQIGALGVTELASGFPPAPLM